jgi:uncharacterized SAM-binding protein YcdF (DUF218 family)
METPASPDSPIQQGSGRAGVLAYAARALALWFGAFTLLNVAVALRVPGFDPNLWWVDLRFLPSTLSRLLLGIAGVLLIAHALRPPSAGWRRWGAPVALALLGVAALSNAVSFYRAWSAGSIRPHVPIPLSVVIAGLLIWLAFALLRPAPVPSRGWRVVAVIITSGLFVVCLPLSQFLFFGTTDYRRAADAIVVLGAKVNPGGVTSLSLGDRMATAVELYDEGLAPTLIVSGGLEPSGYDETAVMRGWAIAHGVPEQDILLDPNGVNTDATVRDTAAMFAQEGISRVLVVSHFYHLPRIKLAYQKAGYDVATVPSRNSPIPQLPLIVAREIPAFWVYYLRAAVG